MAESPHTHIEAFAQLMAQLDDPFAERAVVLRDAGLDEVACLRLVARWRDDLTARPDGPERLALRFGDAYERATLALGARRRGEGMDGDPDPRFLNTDAQAWRAEAAAVPLQAHGEPPPTLAAPAPPSMPSPLGVSSIEPPAAPPVPPSMAFSQPVEPSVSIPSPSARWVPEGMRGFSVHGGTQLAAEGPRGPALPFDPNAKPALPAPETSRVPAGMKNFSVRGGTQLSSEEPRGAALPFESNRGPSSVGPSAVAAPQSIEPPLLSLEQYASLCVELAASPAQTRELLARYRITEEQRRAIEGHWQARMAGDPAIAASWERACAAYKAWLVQTGGARR